HVGSYVSVSVVSPELPDAPAIPAPTLPALPVAPPVAADPVWFCTGIGALASPHPGAADIGIASDNSTPTIHVALVAFTLRIPALPEEAAPVDKPSHERELMAGDNPEIRRRRPAKFLRIPSRARRAHPRRRCQRGRSGRAFFCSSRMRRAEPMPRR